MVLDLWENNSVDAFAFVNASSRKALSRLRELISSYWELFGKIDNGEFDNVN